MGLFKKKAADTAALSDAAPSAELAGEVDPANPFSSAAGQSPADAAAGGVAASAPQLTEQPSRSSFGETLQTATTTTVSGAEVTVLIIWTILVTGWTGFQIVFNSLTWAELQRTAFARPPKTPESGFQGISRMEQPALWIIVAIECVVLVFFLSLTISLMWVPSIGSCRSHKRARRTKRSFLPWLLTLVLVASAWFKLYTLSSVLNKMNYQKEWCATNDNLDIKYTFDPSQAPPPPKGCQPAPVVPKIRQTMVFAMLTIAFHMLLYFWHQPKGTFGKVFGFIPAVLVAALLLLKPVTSLMNFFYTQNAFTSQGNFTFTAEIIVALIEFITAVWLSVYMGWAVHSIRIIPRFTNTLMSCCGREYEDVYYERERERERQESRVSRASSGSGGKKKGWFGRSSDAKAADAMEAGEQQAEAAAAASGRKSYSLRAASKSIVQQYFFMTQIPAIFGFVSPMITYFALHVTNWWVVFDIIVGAVLVFIYMVMCAFQRQILSPAKARS